MKEKAAMIKVAIQNGITDLDDIIERYNRFDGGGYYIAQSDNTRVALPKVDIVMEMPKKEEKIKYVRNPELAENWRVYDRAKEGGFDRNKRTKEANKYTIPYIKDKEIRLTTGRYNTGKISTNLLDSIYDASKRTGVPLDIALGLAGRESTLGIGRGFKEGQSVSGTDLYSNWQQVAPYVISNSIIKEYNRIYPKYKKDEPLTTEEADAMIRYFDAATKETQSVRPMRENPIDNALKFYMTGKYNPGDKNHSKMVKEDARILMSDPAIIKWLNTKYQNGGFKDPYKHGDIYKDSSECAYFSNHTLNDYGYMMSGNAWTPRGADLLYSGFEGLDRPQTYNEKDYDKYARGAVSNVYNNFITRDTLDPNEVYTVNMFYSTSPNKEKAFNEGTIYGTHTGYLSYEPKDDTWYVTHNIHNKISKERFGDLQNSKGKIGVTAIYKPRKNTLFNRIRTKLGFKDGGFLDAPIL